MTSPEAPVRVALIGGGWWARTMHVPALRALPGVDIVAVACRTEASARDAAKSLAILRWTTDFRELLRDPDIDVVIIVTPSFVREAILTEAAAQKKRIVCIKPLATNLAEARRIAAAVKQAGVDFFYAENVPFIPAVRRLVKLARGGRLGSLFRVRCALGVHLTEEAPRWYFESDRGVDLFCELTSHSIAACRALIQDDIAWVHAEAGNYVLGHALQGPDTAVITLGFCGGAIAQCEDSWSLVGGPETRIEVFGDKGRAVADAVYSSPLTMLGGAHPDNRAGQVEGALLAPGRWASVAVDEPFVQDGHLAMFAHYFSSLASGTVTESTLDDAVAVATAVEAARLSWKTGQRVALTEL